MTLAALGEIFEAARGIMGWLGDCAKVYHSVVLWAVGYLLATNDIIWAFLLTVT